MFQTLLFVLYFTVLLVLSGYGLHRSLLVLLCARYARRMQWLRRGPDRPALTEDLPCVTIQLPLFNEMYVVDRLIDAVCDIDYPRDSFFSKGDRAAIFVPREPSHGAEPVGSRIEAEAVTRGMSHHLLDRLFEGSLADMVAHGLKNRVCRAGLSG